MNERFELVIQSTVSDAALLAPKIREKMLANHLDPESVKITNIVHDALYMPLEQYQQAHREVAQPGFKLDIPTEVQ